MKARLPDPPEGLSDQRRELWTATVRDYELDLLELQLLRLALEALDRVDDARREIAEHGAFVADRYGGRRASPALALERDARTSFTRIWRELALDGTTTAGTRPRRPLGRR